ncbi:MAG: hypothetical protein RL145_1355 [Pseudomonadota bacterium]
MRDGEKPNEGSDAERILRDSFPGSSMNLVWGASC